MISNVLQEFQTSMGCEQCKNVRRKSIYEIESSKTFENLPTEIVFEIFDRLEATTIFTSLHNVCRRLNKLISIYDRFDLRLNSISISDFGKILKSIRPEQIVSLTLSDGATNSCLIEFFLKTTRLEQFQRVRRLTLINVDDTQKLIDILRAVPSKLQHLSIDNKQQFLDRTLNDILMKTLRRTNIETFSMSLQRNENFIWTSSNSIREIRFNGVCSLSLFRTILKFSTNLNVFQADDLDFDDEKPIENVQTLKSLSLIYARTELSRLETFLSQFSSLVHLKFFNVYDFNSFDNFSPSSSFDGSFWRKIVRNIDKFELILTTDEQIDSDFIFQSFRNEFWRRIDFQIGIEQIDDVNILYSLPFGHSSFFLDRKNRSIIADHANLRRNPMENVKKLRIDLNFLIPTTSNVDRTRRIENFLLENENSPIFPNATDLILDGRWSSSVRIDSIFKLIDRRKIVKIVRFDRSGATDLRNLIEKLENVESLTITSSLIDDLDPSSLKIARRFKSILVFRFETLNESLDAEKFSRIFPSVENLDVPVDSIRCCRFFVERYRSVLKSGVFRFRNSINNESFLLLGKVFVENERFRIVDRDVFFWFNERK